MIAPTASSPIKDLQSLLDDFLARRGTVTVLEAGCGSASRIDFGAQVRIVGIDISRKQLERNRDLSERLLGDIQRYPLGSDYDVVVCWDVLEHLTSPEMAVENMMGAAARGGLIVLAVPNIWSPKGLVTKLTPHRFHVWAYKRAGYRADDSEDLGPFPTFLRLSMSPRRLERSAVAHGFTVVYSSYRESALQRKVRERLRIRGRVWRAIRSATGLLTRGAFDVAGTDFLIVLRAPA